MSRNATNGYVHTADELAAIVDSSTRAELESAGWSDGHGPSRFEVGQVVYAWIRGNLRRGKVSKVGRKNVSVECTTTGAIDEARRYGWSGPCLTVKVVAADEVFAERLDPAKVAAELDAAIERGAVRVVNAEPVADDAAPAELVEPKIDEPTIDEAIAIVEAEHGPLVTAVNREAWLTAAVELMRPLFAAIDVELPETVRVSCGFPGGKSPAKTIGQCWYTADDKVAQVFVSPILVDPVDVLGVLVHELIHAWDRGQSGHAGAFRACAKRIGLTGKMTATTVGDELRETLAEMVGELGGYPHARLNLIAAAEKKQGTRMLKVECPACGYTLRTTAKWLEIGVPTCPCGTEMEAVA